ncbi:hypothetical protein HK096_000073, partial [Nowakowskiella sp. JEL0078]
SLATSTGCCSGEQLASFTANSPILNAGLVLSAKFSTINLWHYPAIILNSTAAKPILTFEGGSDPLFPSETVGAVLISHEDGREEMAFFLPFASWSITSLVLGHMWVSWGTRGIYLGNRQIYLNLQVDDLFLDTESPVIPNVSNTTYRVTNSDIDNIIAWQNNLKIRLAPGSDFRLEFAFNGNGILAKANANAALDVDTEDYVGINFIKPLGGGEYRWPIPPPTFSNLKITDTSLANSDPLFVYFKDPAKQANFFWLSHTFTHENLNNASYTDTDNEIKYNVQVAKALLKMYDKSYFSQNSIVTPQISGVFNGDALQCLLDNGILSIVGDDSRPNLVPSNGNWYPLITTTELSNYAGYLIIPRSPTEIYFSCSTFDQNTYVYNSLYQKLLGISNHSQILNREGDRVVRKLLSLHPDPYQFHQANLRKAQNLVTIGRNQGYFSLIQEWTETVIMKLGQLTNWPVTSLKQDDLADLYNKRLALDSCGLKVTLIYDSSNTQITSIQATSENKCEVPITVPGKASAPLGSISSQIGKQPLVIKLQLSKSSKSIILETPVQVKPPTSSTTTTPVSQVRVKMYNQCGGIGYSGSTFCETGSICKYQNAYYSQCLPGNPIQSTRNALTTSTNTFSVSCARLYGQCGGYGFVGPTCCESGSVCKVGNAFYSQCVPSKLIANVVEYIGLDQNVVKLDQIAV